MTRTFQFSDQPVASTDLRNVMGYYLTGVTVVTVTGPDEKPYGLTVTSFNSVSLSPPLILWSLDNRNDRLQMFKDARGFAVNIMAADQLTLCQKFAAADNDRFSNCNWHFGAYGQPLLENALANLECRPWAEYDGGDHTIFVGEVMSIKQKKGKAAAFFNGKLGQHES
ncbi:flavin reductase family protein [Candidatus Puniceispirillum sp.]|nr:flavin reductase family protein [Candidatus Puniceispirillum sp.]